MFHKHTCARILPQHYACTMSLSYQVVLYDTLQVFNHLGACSDIDGHFAVALAVFVAVFVAVALAV